jgi:hypothetical protein
VSDDAQRTLDPAEFVAEDIRYGINGFAQKFRELNEGGQLRKLLRETRTLTGAPIEQAPEVFTEQYLIEPVLHGLGYLNPISDDYSSDAPHFIRRPITYEKVEPRQPDYLLKNIPAGDDASGMVCIVEAKAANREQPTGSKQDATDDIREYLDEDTFCKYLRDIDQRYLAGIGTDGLRWTLWMKDLETGEVKQDHPKIDISRVVENEAKRLDTIEGEVAAGRARDRNVLTEEFVPAFAATNLSSHIIDSFADSQS